MAVSEQELAAFATSHDIISLGMAADEVRRARHGARTTFVRVADVGRRRRIAGRLAGRSRRESGSSGRRRTREAAIARVGRSCGGGPAACRFPAFRWPISKQLAAREGVTLRALLEELQAAGLELVAEAPFDRLRRRSPLDRRSEHRRARAGAPDDRSVRVRGLRCRSSEPCPTLQTSRRRDPGVRAAAATHESGRADHRLRRRQARGAGAARLRQRPVDPGGLVALRPEAGAGGAHGRRRRCRRRVGGRRHDRRPASRAARGDPAQHSSRPVSSRSSATGASIRFPHERRPPRRGRLSERPAARLRPRSSAAASAFASTCRRAARGCCTRARSISV